jgi:4-amino-4-deoxy-L-arabinose transferase-like glycosyltransferase
MTEYTWNHKIPMTNKNLKFSDQDTILDRHRPVRILNLMEASPVYTVGVVLILGILLAGISMLHHPPSLKSGETDSWWMIALNLNHGHGYSLCLKQYFPFCGPSNQVTAMREPLPVFLFALVARLGNDSLWLAAIVQALVYLAIILSVYFLTREWADARSGVIASFLWTIYLPALELIPQVSGDLLATLCLTLGILFVFRARKTMKTRDWLIAGFWLGLAVISRSATLVIALVLIIGLGMEFWHQHLKAKNIVRPTLILFSVVILLMTPWLIRNKLALGRPIVGSSLTGYNLYRHNYIIEKTGYFHYVGPEEGLQAIQNLLVRRTDLRGDENEAKMDIIYRGEALQIIKSHPSQYILLSLYRFFPLWFDWKIAEVYGHPTNHYGDIVMTLQALSLVLAILGLRHKARLTWPIWGSILAISFAYMAVDARMLYVMPVMPLLISLSAVGTNNLLKKILREK